MRVLASAALTLSLFLGFATRQANQTEEKKLMNVKKITPVLLVNEIEPILPFWIDRLGFTKTIEVPDGAKLGEVMYQTYASVEHDAPPAMAAAARNGPTYLYLEVDDLDAVLAAMKDVNKVMPERTAFYGMREFVVQDPAGHFITFAQPTAPPNH
jgi:uncharacterized glyoxalase superfamily protein PhnB